MIIFLINRCIMFGLVMLIWITTATRSWRTVVVVMLSHRLKQRRRLKCTILSTKRAVRTCSWWCQDIEVGRNFVRLLAIGPWVRCRRRYRHSLWEGVKCIADDGCTQLSWWIWVGVDVARLSWWFAFSPLCSTVLWMGEKDDDDGDVLTCLMIPYLKPNLDTWFTQIKFQC